jgi:hypothetical protein
MNNSIKKTDYYIGYDVKKTKSGKIWTRVAAAWPHREGKDGFTVQLIAVPLSGTIVFVPPKPEGEEGKTKPTEE